MGRRGTVGVGISGAISPASGLVKNANSTWLNGRRMADDLPRLLARPVRFENDANCFALSEATDGAAQGATVVFGVILGTGTGGGVVVGRAALTGANAIAGEWGHNPLPAPRTTSGRARSVTAAAGAASNILVRPGARARLLCERRCIDAAEIAGRARSGEAAADACLARYEIASPVRSRA